MWFFRKWFWNVLAWLKFTLNKPITIPLPPEAGTVIRPIPIGEAVPGLAQITGIVVGHPDDIPADEKSVGQSLVYKLQVWLYSRFPAMQTGLPEIAADPDQALKQAYTWLHRTRFPAPELPPEFRESPDLGSLAVRGPYACYTERSADDEYRWDLEKLGAYEHHEGLHKLGVKVHFKPDPARRALEAFRIDSVLGATVPGDAAWETAKRLALCAVTTHASLVWHFNGVHLASGAHLAIATRNRLPATHPLCRLLWPCMHATQQSNDMITRGQMLPGGDFETIFSLSFDGMCRLFGDSYRAYRFVVNDPGEDAKRRQVRDAGFDMPTQQNLEALFDVMHAYARNYLGLYYAGDAAIRDDAAILAWLDELNALIPNGVEVSLATLSFDTLARLVARFIYLVTVQHEILGSFLWNYQLWSHRQPVRVYADGRRVPLDVYQRLVNANYNLNVHRRELMHDFSYLALDEPGRAAMTEFQDALKALQASFDRQGHAVWKLCPDALKANINA